PGRGRRRGPPAAGRPARPPGASGARAAPPRPPSSSARDARPTCRPPCLYLLVPTLRVGTPLATLRVALAPPTIQGSPRHCGDATRSVAWWVPTQSVGTREGGAVTLCRTGR